MIKSNGYFHAHGNLVYFLRNGEWLLSAHICSTEYPEQAQRIADQLNRDLEQLEQLPRATLEHHPGRLTTF